MLEGDAELGPVAALYGLPLGGLDPHQALGPFVAQLIGGEPVVGDQVEWAGRTWTVAQMEGNRIRKVGLKLPAGGAGPLLML
ncbi:K(+)/H(+) antiporter NhaP2 [compost metagenome]